MINDITLLDEIAEQDLDTVNGGTVTYPILSWALGNDGYVCTLTVECQPNCG